MRWTSVVAIYFLFFIASAFVLLPFGVKTDEEAGEKMIPGQAQSAPHRFQLGGHLLRAALLGGLLTLLYTLNYIYGWVEPDDLDLYRRMFG